MTGVAIVIPARFASTRYPGKPLVGLKGAGGAVKPLIQRVWEVAGEVPEADAVYIATDDDRIAEAARGFGADVVLTSESCRNGTERCADAIAKAGIDPEIVVNLQGDAPLTPPDFLSRLIRAMQDAPDIDAATPVLRCDAETLDMFLEDRRAGRVGGTTAVFGSDNRALYFSKEVIPYTGAWNAGAQPVPVFHHVGIYAYRPAALERYLGWPEGPLEKLEGLEQLRFLENGAVLQCVEVEGQGRVFWELNNPQDVARIESIFAREGTS